MTKQHPSNPKRAALFKLVCLSLFTTSSMGFTTSSPALSKPTVHFAGVNTAGVGKRRSSLQMTSSTAATFQETPRLTFEEEKYLLRQAVELRRLTQLEDSSSKSLLTMTLSPSELAREAGYGTSVEEYEMALINGQQARELLVTRNMGLVHYCLQQIVGKRKTLNSLSREDLVQEGAIGLAKAVDKWNPAIGGKFSTYAVYWIRAAILRGIADRDDLLRVPVHVSQAIKSIDKAARRLGLSLEHWRDFQDELQQETGLSNKNLQDAMKAKSRRHGGGYVAFESWMQRSDTAGDVQTTSSLLTISEDTSKMESEHLRTTLSKYLRPKEMEALSWRYGLVQEEEDKESPQAKANRYLAEAEKELFGSNEQTKIEKRGRFGEAMTFNEVGKKMQVSAEYTRKLCHAALKKLRQAAEEGHLEPALLC